MQIEEQLETALRLDIEERVHHAMKHFEYDFVSAENFLSHTAFSCFMSIPEDILVKNRKRVFKRREKALAKEFDAVRRLEAPCPPADANVY